jgi:hypothetical protein
LALCSDDSVDGREDLVAYGVVILVPTFIDPTVTTPKSLGAISRETMPCSLRTIDDASTAGSTPNCGIEP